MLTDLQTRKFTQQFHQLDADGGGTLKWNDFESLLERLRQARGWEADSPRTAQARACYDSLWKALEKHGDRDHDGAVSLEEWLDFHRVALCDSQVLLQINPAYEELVVTMSRFVQETLDDDGDGRISFEEYRQFCKAYGINETEAERCFRGLDRNGDGILTRAEILDLVLDYYCSEESESPGNVFFGLLTSS